MTFAAEGGEGPTPYEVLLHAAMMGQATRFTRQDGVEETWRIMQPLLGTTRRAVLQPWLRGRPLPRPGRECGGWEEPWVPS